MSEQTRPQPPRAIDRADVLGELEHRFKEADPSHAIAWVLDELVELDILSFRERADDPSSDPIGTVREGAGPQYLNAWVKAGHNLWVAVNASAAENMTDTQLLASAHPVIGAVPGTPAAEADKPERQVPLELRQKLADVLVSGDKDRAIRIALNWGMDYDDAVTYIESMPEYQTGRNHRPVEDVALPPLHVDNEAIVQGQYYTEKARQRQPREFRPDGPEPPVDVTALEDEGPDWGDMKYLLRTGDLWCWSPSPKLVWPDHSDPVLWERAARQAAGPFREVV